MIYYYGTQRIQYPAFFAEYVKEHKARVVYLQREHEGAQREHLSFFAPHELVSRLNEGSSTDFAFRIHSC